MNFRYRSSKGDGGKLIGWVNRVGTGRRGVNHIMVHLWGRTICGVTLSNIGIFLWIFYGQFVGSDHLWGRTF